MRVIAKARTHGKTSDLFNVALNYMADCEDVSFICMNEDSTKYTKKLFDVFMVEHKLDNNLFFENKIEFISVHSLLNKNKTINKGNKVIVDELGIIIQEILQININVASIDLYNN